MQPCPGWVQNSPPKFQLLVGWEGQAMPGIWDTAPHSLCPSVHSKVQNRTVAVSGLSSRLVLPINHLPTLPFLSASASSASPVGSACTHTSSSITPGAIQRVCLHLLGARPFRHHIWVFLCQHLLTLQHREVAAGPGAALGVLVGFSCSHSQAPCRNHGFLSILWFIQESLMAAGER